MKIVLDLWSAKVQELFSIPEHYVYERKSLRYIILRYIYVYGLFGPIMAAESLFSLPIE